MIDNNKDSPIFTREKQIYCKKHHSDKIFLFCVAKGCNSPLCINCLNDHCLFHQGKSTIPQFMELPHILKFCEEKLQNYIKDISSRVESIRSNPEDTNKRQSSERELEKILKSKEFLINYIEKYYQEIQDTFNLATKPLETKLEQKLTEIKNIQETLSGSRALETISKVYDRNLEKEVKDIIESFSSGENIKDSPKITIDYTRVNSNFKEELQKFIQMASPTKSITSAISKESETSTQSSGIQTIHNILQNQTLKFNNIQEVCQRNSELLQKVASQNNSQTLSITPPKIIEEIPKLLPNRLTFSAYIGSQTSDEKTPPETPNLMNSSIEESDFLRKKKQTVGPVPDTPFNLGVNRAASTSQQEGADKSPTNKGDGKSSIYRQKRSIIKETQAELKAKENDYSILNNSLFNNEKTPPLKLNSMLTSSDFNIVSDFRKNFTDDTNLLGSSPPRFVEDKKISEVIPSTSSQPAPISFFNFNFLEKVKEISSAIDKKNDSLISNYNSFLEEEDSMKTPYSIVPSNQDNDIDCLLFDRSENENSILNTSAFASYDEEKSEKLEFLIEHKDYFPSYCKKKVLCFFPWRTKEVHIVNLDMIDPQSKEMKFEMIKFDLLPFNIPDYHSTTITPEGEIYLIGGRNSDEPSIKYSDTWSFIIETRSFFPKTQMKIKRDSHSACYLNGFIYVMGGVTIDALGNKKVIKNCEKFDPKNNKWTEIPDLPLPLCNQSSSTFNGRYIYSFGGRSQNQKISNNILKLDTYTNKWMSILIKKESKVRFNLTSQSACCQINKNQILVFGGYQNDKKVSNQTFLFEVGLEKESGDKEVFQIKHLDKNNTTFAAPFWDKQVFIQNNTIYCLQNVVAHNNSKVSFNAARRIVTFDGKNWVNLN